MLASAEEREAQGHEGCYTSPTIGNVLDKTQTGEFGRPTAKTKVGLWSQRCTVFGTSCWTWERTFLAFL